MENKQIETILDNMKKGELKEIVYKKGILTSTKTLEKISENKFYFHVTNGAWEIAELTKLQACKLLTGKLNILELKFI